MLNITFTPGPPAQAWTQINDGASPPVYTGVALSFDSGRGTQGITTFTVTSVSKAAAAVVAVTAHGLSTGMTVTVAGGTADWAGVNGIQVVTVINANSFSIPINSGGYAGTFAGSITTGAPLTTQAIWYITKTVYVGTANTANLNAGGNSANDKIWDNRALLAYY